MIMTLTNGAVRAVTGLTRRADAVLVRQAADNAASSLSGFRQRRAEGELTLHQLERIGRPRRRTAPRVA